VAKQGSTGAEGSATGAGIFNQGGAFVVKNSVFGASALGSNGGGAITDAGYNFSSDSSFGFNALGSRNATDPQLGALADNGGKTLTMALLTNSPAIDAITDADGNGAPLFDQRDVTRAAPFDAGAFEVGATLSGPGLTIDRQES